MKLVLFSIFLFLSVALATPRVVLVEEASADD
jgi:hypothetical protein